MMKFLRFVVVICTACTLGAADLPLVRLGVDQTRGNSGSLEKVQISAGGNASVEAVDQGMILGPLAEGDNSGTIRLEGDGVWPAKEFTVTTWVRLPTLGYEGNGVCLFDAYDAEKKTGVQCNLSFGTGRELRLYTIINGKELFTPYFKSRVKPGTEPEWFWIALRFDGTVAVAAMGTVRGAFEMSPVLKYFDQPTAAGPASAVTIGFRNNTRNRALKGNLADFRIYDRTLRMEELQKVMKEKKFAETLPPAGATVVLLAGDSIRMAYAPIVKRMSGENRFVCWPAENSEDSRNLLARMPAYLEEFRPQVVVWNAGLHDIKSRRADGQLQVSADEYRRNLDAIAMLLQKAGVKSIYALTTPVISERHNRIQAFDRNEADVLRCNEIALGVMKQHQIPVVNLHAVIAPECESLLKPDGVHPTPAGAEKLAAAVTEALNAPK